MNWESVQDDSRIGLYNEMFRDIAVESDPWIVLDRLISTMRRLQGPRAYIRLATRDLPEGHYRITRFQSESGEDLVPPVGWGATLTHLPVYSEGLLADIVLTPEPKLLNSLDCPHDSILEDKLLPYNALMAVPIYSRAEPGDWLVLLSVDPVTFTSDDLAEGVLRANIINAALDNLFIAERLKAAQARIQQDVDAIAEIQQSLVAECAQNIPGVQVATSYGTFDRAGGDYFHFRQIHDGRWLIFIADAAGHGASAAVVTAQMHALLSRLPESVTKAAQVLEYLNRYLRMWSPDWLVTAFCGIYEPNEQILSCARAGHDYPYLMHEDTGQVERLDGWAGLPLGIQEGLAYEEGRLELGPGDRFLLYTDGITEARSPAGKLFGADRLISALRAAPGDATRILGAIKDEVRNFQEDERPHDDQTIVVVRVKLPTD